MSESTTQETPGTREQAVAALDAAEKALTWTTSRGTWDPVRDYISGRRGLIKHLQTGDDLAEFVHPADAEHACLWHPRRIKALIDRDRAILERHKSDPVLSDGACSCGWQDCPEVAAIVAFWTSTDMPDITPSTEQQRPMLDRETAIEAAAKARYYENADYDTPPWEEMSEDSHEGWRDGVRIAVDAVLALLNGDES